MTDYEIVEAVDQIADTVTDEAQRLGISPVELADRILNEIKAQDTIS